MSSPKEMTRQAFDCLSLVEQREALRGGFKLTDPPSVVVPDTTRLVSIENGERRVFTRQTFDALPVAEKSRIGARLRIEHVEPPATV